MGKKKSIYLVSYVCFDGYDDNLCTDLSQPYTTKKEAMKAFRRDCRTARADAREEDWPREDWKSIDENRYDDVYYVSRTNETYYTKVELLKREI